MLSFYDLLSNSTSISLQVGLWLVEMDLNQYVNNFKSHDVDGHALLTADGNKLKVCYILTASDVEVSADIYVGNNIP